MGETQEKISRLERKTKTVISWVWSRGPSTKTMLNVKPVKDFHREPHVTKIQTRDLMAKKKLR